MRKFISLTIVLCMMIGVLSGCNLSLLPRDKLPTLTVTCGDSSVDTATDSHSYGDLAPLVAESHPLFRRSELPVLCIYIPEEALEEDFCAELIFDVAPDSVSVECWSTELWDKEDVKSENIDVSNGNITLKSYGALYSVTAQWDGESGGSVTYCFYTELYQKIDNYDLSLDCASYLDTMGFDRGVTGLVLRTLVEKYTYNGESVFDMCVETTGCGTYANTHTFECDIMSCGSDYNGSPTGYCTSKDYFYTKVPLGGFYMPYLINFEDSVNDAVKKMEKHDDKFSAWIGSRHKAPVNFTLDEGTNSTITIYKDSKDFSAKNKIYTYKIEYVERSYDVVYGGSDLQLKTRRIYWLYEENGNKLTEFGFSSERKYLRNDFGIPKMTVIENNSGDRTVYDAAYGTCEWTYADFDGNTKYFIRNVSDVKHIEGICPTIYVPQGTDTVNVRFDRKPDTIEVRRYSKLFESEHTVLNVTDDDGEEYTIQTENLFGIVEVIAEWELSNQGFGGTVHYYFYY